MIVLVQGTRQIKDQKRLTTRGLDYIIRDNMTL